MAGGQNAHRTGWRSMIECNGPLQRVVEFPDKIATVSERLMGVQIECQPAVELIRRYSRQNVLIYADPPYVHST
ncbi:DNA adenine methylase [Sporolactobacillus shoreicorticis]|uniref:DNA adenine methylase n=1 Tax=Sporolactobacillus shoreicorticis TaxID=1923877 RepID=A0ABW5RZW3_9BACL|nr:DNA adenine methylase [Sporolactobacillus shoreicorticis]MCO7124729.1 DNA adenine methylase [Sporolactobacillus shoreicorticis]